MAETLILHSDLNCYYASVEMNEHPDLRGKQVAVCGSTENRHGIVLTASYPAKHAGVKTGMANWQAKQACPGLIMVEPHYLSHLALLPAGLSTAINPLYFTTCSRFPPDAILRTVQPVIDD